MAKFKMTVLTSEPEVVTARVGGTRTAGTEMTDADKGKLLKLAADSQYSLCAAGDEIEGVLTSVETAPLDDFTIGSVQTGQRFNAICDGVELTPGTGTVTVGSLVKCGTVVALGTALTSTTGPKVVKATDASDDTFKWRVVSLGSTGAVGDTCVVERV